MNGKYANYTVVLNMWNFSQNSDKGRCVQLGDRPPDQIDAAYAQHLDDDDSAGNDDGKGD